MNCIKWLFSLQTLLRLVSTNCRDEKSCKRQERRGDCRAVCCPNLLPWYFKMASNHAIAQWISLPFSISVAKNWSNLRRSISGM